MRKAFEVRKYERAIFVLPKTKEPVRFHPQFCDGQRSKHQSMFELSISGVD